MKQQDRLLVSWLMDIKLKVKDGTQSTFSRIRLGDIWTVPMWVTITLSPFGNWTKEVIELVILVNKLTECTMWSVAPVSSTQVSWLKVGLCEGLTAKIECCILKHIGFCRKVLDIPERAELAMWIASLELPELDGCVFNNEINCWYYFGVKEKLGVWCAASFRDWSKSIITWFAMGSFPFCLYPGGNPTSL